MNYTGFMRELEVDKGNFERFSSRGIVPEEHVVVVTVAVAYDAPWF